MVALVLGRVALVGGLVALVLGRVALVGGLVALVLGRVALVLGLFARNWRNYPLASWEVWVTAIDQRVLRLVN